MNLLHFWLAYLIISLSLIIGKAISCRLMNVHHKHYQIGFSPSLFQFTLWSVKFSIGILIPLPFLWKTYEIHDEKKQKLTPLWIRREIPFIKRLTGILSGVMFLYLTAILIYAGNFYSKEDFYLSLNEVNKNGIYVDSLGRNTGLRSGDKIISINGEQPERFNELMEKLYLDSISTLSLIRDNSSKEITVSFQDIIASNYPFNNPFLFPISTPHPFTIESVLEEGGAFKAGILPGDKIVSLNEDHIPFFQDFLSALDKYAYSKVQLTLQRKGSDSLIHKTVQVDESGRIGILLQSSLTYTTEKKTILGSLNSGNVFLKNYLRQFKTLFIGEPNYRSIGGFQTIGNIFSSVPIWEGISLILLVYVCWSFIPTPVTEGRYLLALFIDIIIKLPRTAPNWISCIIYLLLAFAANFSDIYKTFN